MTSFHMAFENRTILSGFWMVKPTLKTSGFQMIQVFECPVFGSPLYQGNTLSLPNVITSLVNFLTACKSLCLCVVAESLDSKNPNYTSLCSKKFYWTTLLDNFLTWFICVNNSTPQNWIKLTPPHFTNTTKSADNYHLSDTAASGWTDGVVACVDLRCAEVEQEQELAVRNTI